MPEQLELSLWHNSPLGVARCLGCKKTWPCHYSAWGRVNKVSRCNNCGGDVIFEMPTFNEENNDHSNDK